MIEVMLQVSKHEYIKEIINEMRSIYLVEVTNIF